MIFVIVDSIKILIDMYLDVCEHPLRLKINGHYQYVPCGKCNTCTNRKASQWIQRVEDEFKCHKYAYFVTLTYDEKNVPRLYLNQDSHLGDYYLVDDQTGDSFSLNDIPGFKPQSRLYVARRKNIPYGKVSDVQNFLKRFRFYFSNLMLNNYVRNSTLRYFAVSEYGPSTYRPHYHIILFFSADELARRFREVVLKSWRLGAVNFKCCDKGTAKYVARYCNCVASLPKVYHHKSLRPFLVSSKYPAIGTLSLPSFFNAQLFYGGYRSYLRQSSSGVFKDVPVWKCLENRLFPKVQGFADFSHSERVTLYSVYSTCPVQGFRGFVDWVSGFVRDPYLEYFDSMFTYEGFVNLPWLSRVLYGIYEQDNVGFYPKFFRLKQLYYTSARVVLQSRVFGVSLDFYVGRIEEYYATKDLLRLKQFYEYQENFKYVYHNSLPLLHLYPDAARQFMKFLDSNCDLKLLTDVDVEFYESFGFKVLDCDPLLVRAQFEESCKFKFEDLSRMKSLNANIVDKSRKTKKRNDYVQAHQRDFTFNLLKNYE